MDDAHHGVGRRSTGVGRRRVTASVAAVAALLISSLASAEKPGRFTVVTHPKFPGAHTYLIDTETGRTWSLCKSLPDKVAEAKDRTSKDRTRKKVESERLTEIAEEARQAAEAERIRAEAIGSAAATRSAERAEQKADRAEAAAQEARAKAERAGVAADQADADASKMLDGWCPMLRFSHPVIKPSKADSFFK